MASILTRVRLRITGSAQNNTDRREGNQMKTVTVKGPEELDQKLAAVAEKTGESKSNVIGAAVKYLLSARDNIAPDSCLDLAKDLAGSVDGPGNLSYSKKHMKGYGQ
jgi:hypothetical protein